METFPFGKVIIALIVIMAIVAGVGLYLGSNDSTPPPATTTSPTTATPTTTTPTTTPGGEQTYAITIEYRTSIGVQARNALSELMTNLQIGDVQWRTDISIQLKVIQALYDEAIAIDPPSSMTYIHDKYVEAMAHYNTATQLITQGIEEVDANLLEQSTAELLAGDQLLTEAIELLNEFAEAHST